ncbi:hypothetical protein ILYODFUR_029467 [Ilyodon furcidens]|uniref:Uncharacterized protein n=1 Tax=Ilyodon furcidens TaxID=33524 RepID=A0ABV0V742_9TELE
MPRSYEKHLPNITVNCSKKGTKSTETREESRSSFLFGFCLLQPQFLPLGVHVSFKTAKRKMLSMHCLTHVSSYFDTIKLPIKKNAVPSKRYLYPVNLCKWLSCYNHKL